MIVLVGMSGDKNCLMYDCCVAIFILRLYYDSCMLIFVAPLFHRHLSKPCHVHLDWCNIYLMQIYRYLGIASEPPILKYFSI